MSYPSILHLFAQTRDVFAQSFSLHATYLGYQEDLALQWCNVFSSCTVLPLSVTRHDSMCSLLSTQNSACVAYFYILQSLTMLTNLKVINNY